jgi:hypothetical protein
LQEKISGMPRAVLLLFYSKVRAQYRLGNANPSAEDINVYEQDMRFQNPCTHTVTSFRNVLIQGWLLRAGEYERKGGNKTRSWFVSTRSLMGLTGPPKEVVFVRILFLFKHVFHDGIERGLLGVVIVPRKFAHTDLLGREIVMVDPRSFREHQFSVISTESVLCPISFLRVSHLQEPCFLSSGEGPSVRLKLEGNNIL